ncbi:MAG: hypothetical protein BWY79_00887 [Actinobacteria bacterium ADurb.Bin444]|nr:MAG: hypothetical protein BWY79_00887 [Actinobacteria bacterium ADurb.Bin444]
MILSQVRERHRSKPQSIRATQFKRVRGDLHHCGAIPRGYHGGQVALQIRRLRSGSVRGVMFPADHTLHCSEQTRANTGILQQPRHQVGSGCLAVGAGDPHQPEPPTRITVERPSHPSHGRSHIGNHYLGYRQSQRPLHTQGHRPARNGVTGELVAVEYETGNAEKQRTRFDGATVIGEGHDVHKGMAGKIVILQPVEEFGEVHGFEFYHRGTD